MLCANLLLAEAQFDLQLSVADDELLRRRKLYGERIVGEAADDVVGLREVEHEVACLIIGTVEVAGDEDKCVVMADACHLVEHLVEHRRLRGRR